MAMSFAILGLVVLELRFETRVCGKSFPDFWEKLGGLYR